MDITQNKIAIIGGGIAGLTMGIVLKRFHQPFIIYESSPFCKPIGAGLMLAPNAMQIYSCLGLETKLLEVGNQIDCMYITDQNLKPLTSLDIRNLLKKHTWRNLAIHRADLHRVLLEEVGEENIVLGKRLSQIQCDSNFTQLQFEDGSSMNHSVVIGADGINSIVRKLVTKSIHLRPTDQVCWRGVLKYTLPVEFQNQSYEAWHDGKRFGYVQINAQEVYWYFVSLKEQHITTETIDEALNDFFPLAKELVKLTTNSKIFKSELADIKPLKNWSHGNSCLIGDAAHATTPNMGQGACLAIEDAYLLGELLSKNDPNKAFQLFRKLRQSRVNSIVSNSRQIGWVSHWKNESAQTFRNFTMRLAPAWATQHHFENLYKVTFLEKK